MRQPLLQGPSESMYGWQDAQVVDSKADHLVLERFKVEVDATDAGQMAGLLLEPWRGNPSLGRPDISRIDPLDALTYSHSHGSSCVEWWPARQSSVVGLV